MLPLTRRRNPSCTLVHGLTLAHASSHLLSRCPGPLLRPHRFFALRPPPLLGHILTPLSSPVLGAGSWHSHAYWLPGGTCTPFGCLYDACARWKSVEGALCWASASKLQCVSIGLCQDVLPCTAAGSLLLPPKHGTWCGQGPCFLVFPRLNTMPGL